MKEADKRYKSRPLEDEIAYMEILIMPSETKEEKEKKLEAFKKLAERAAKSGNTRQGFRAWYETIHYYNIPDIFRNTSAVTEKLRNLNDRQVTGFAYEALGSAYYSYHDYERAIPYLKLALRDSVLFFADRSNLIARSRLAEYYASINELDSSDYYYRSMYDSPDRVKSRPAYDLIAISGIADNRIKRKQYEKALPLLRMCLPEALREKTFPYPFVASRIALSMAESYLKLGKLPQTKTMIDSAQAVTDNAGADKKRLYSLLNKYYAATGNARLSQNYLDTLLATIRESEDVYNAQFVLSGEQNYYESEKELARQELKTEHFKLVGSLIIIGIIAAACLVYIRLYLSKRAAYRALVQRIQQWAKQSVPLSLPAADSVTDEIIDAEYTEITTAPDSRPLPESAVDRPLFDSLERLFQSEKWYCHPDLSLEYVAGKLGVSRTQLSHIVNNFTDKSFSVYVNEYRVKEAVRILSSPGAAALSLEGIAYESGFKSRETFQRTFKKVTGLSPAVFRDNMKR